MTFNDLISKINYFPGLKFAFLICVTFQVFHDLYDPVFCLSKAETRLTAGVERTLGDHGFLLHIIKQTEAVSCTCGNSANMKRCYNLMQ